MRALVQEPMHDFAVGFVCATCTITHRFISRGHGQLPAQLVDLLPVEFCGHQPCHQTRFIGDISGHIGISVPITANPGLNVYWRCIQGQTRPGVFVKNTVQLAQHIGKDLPDRLLDDDEA